jgi:CRISPR-associated protein Cas1
VTTVGPLGDGLPETVPARMVNEFVYCPRLFHLEWVQSRFASNDDVEQGLYVHRVVDEPGGTIPDPDDTHPELMAGRTSRSVWLTSLRLRVTAKIDLVEVSEDGSVVPVDYKKGMPDRDGRPWPSDEVQSALQALVLRDAGYSVSTAEIWYAESRQRVVIPIDDVLVTRTRQTVADLWSVAASDVAPPPLADSPKCPRCSLVGICLPDEINALRHREADGSRRRRIIPSNPDPRPVYIQEQGSVVTVRGGRLEVFKEKEKLDSLRLIDVGQVCLQGNVNVTPQAMRELLSREVPVCWFSYGGWFSGMAQGLPGKNVDLRRSQFTASPERTLLIARRMVEGKIRNSRTLLRRNSRADVANEVESMGRLAGQAAEASGFPTLLGLEGASARIYFTSFTRMLTSDTDISLQQFDSNGRSRRPPPDPVNALLSFAYALLVKDVTTTVTAVGFDPYFGVYHRPRFGRPALALDLAEEFRPLVAESMVLQVINNGEVTSRDFLSRAGGCQLEKEGRRSVIRAYERRMSQEIKHPLFGYRVSYRRAIDVQARLLAAFLLGEVDDYTPFVTR